MSFDNTIIDKDKMHLLVCPYCKYKDAIKIKKDILQVTKIHICEYCNCKFFISYLKQYNLIFITKTE